jgi:hypothetical protein
MKNETRYVKRFAIIPVRLLNGKLIWLRWFTKLQEFKTVSQFVDAGWPDQGGYRDVQKWVTIVKY